MTIVANDVVRVSCRFKNAISGDVVNVYHWVAGPGVSEADGDVITALETKIAAMYATMASVLHQRNVPYDIRYDVVSNVAGKETVVRTLGTYTWTLGAPPSGSGDEMPQQNAFVINYRTDRPKSYGRKYLGSFGETWQDGGAGTGSAVTALTNFAAASIAAVTVSSGDFLPCVFSIFGVYNEYLQLKAAVVNAVSAIQRRRRRNTGG